MKNTKLIYVFLTICVTACGPQLPKRPDTNANTEESAISALKNGAARARECSTQKLAMVNEHEELLRAVIKTFKQPIGQSKSNAQPIQINLKPLAEKYYNRQPDAELDDDIVGIYTSDKFKSLIQDTRIWLTQLSENESLLNNLLETPKVLKEESGVHLADIIFMISKDRDKREVLLSTAKTALCDKVSDENIVDALNSYQVFSEIGPKAFLILKSKLRKTLKALVKQDLKTPASVIEFISLASNSVPKADMTSAICSLDNLDEYEPIFNLLTLLLEAPKDPKESRKLVTLSNFALKFYSMSESNQCTGTSYESIHNENLKDFLLAIADLLVQES